MPFINLTQQDISQDLITVKSPLLTDYLLSLEISAQHIIANAVIGAKIVLLYLSKLYTQDTKESWSVVRNGESVLQEVLEDIDQAQLFLDSKLLDDEKNTAQESETSLAPELLVEQTEL